MKIAREIELRLERLIDGLSATLFRGRMHPVDLANRLVRFVDLSVTTGAAGPQIDNGYVVRVNPSEIDPGVSLEALERELEAVVTSLAREHGWRTSGPVEVRVAGDRSVATGAIRCVAETRPGPMPPWAQLLDARSGILHEIGDNRTIVGRGDDADIRIDHARVSRRHALIHRNETAVWLKDLRSSNGTSLNGGELSPDVDRELRAGDTLAFGPATFSYRLL